MPKRCAKDLRAIVASHEIALAIKKAQLLLVDIYVVSQVPMAEEVDPAIETKRTQI